MKTTFQFSEVLTYSCLDYFHLEVKDKSDYLFRIKRVYLTHNHTHIWHAGVFIVYFHSIRNVCVGMDVHQSASIPMLPSNVNGHEKLIFFIKTQYMQLWFLFWHSGFNDTNHLIRFMTYVQNFTVFESVANMSNGEWTISFSLSPPFSPDERRQQLHSKASRTNSILQILEQKNVRQSCIKNFSSWGNPAEKKPAGRPVTATAT